MGGLWEPRTNMFELLKKFGVEVVSVVYPYRITYDIECFLPKNRLS